jgi:uncharacterized membrane protein YcaP (DUF421 family)
MTGAIAVHGLWQTIWQDMMQFGVPWEEKIIRTIAVYVFLLIGLRLAGKRELGQLNPFDLVVLLILSNTVQNAIIGNDNTVWGGVVGATTLLILNYAVNRLVYNNRKLENLVEGEPDILIEKGCINMKHIECELITMQELEAAARKQGFATLGEVDRAVLESGGVITFKGKTPAVDERRHEELVGHLKQLRLEVAAVQHLHAELAKTQPKPTP